MQEAECLHYKTCEMYKHFVKDGDDIMIATFCDSSTRYKICSGNPDYEDTLKLAFDNR